MLKAPFPYAGGKASVASVIWERLGADVPVYVEAFAGSLAVLLKRPTQPGIETITDSDGMIANVWRAIKHDPDAVAYWADDLVCEVDLHSKHATLVRARADLTERLLADPDYHDAKLAGWWIWGASCWIGSGWCSGRGPWQVVDGRLVKVDTARSSGAGASVPRPHLMTEGKGIVAKVGHLGDAGRGVNRQVPQWGTWAGDLGRGVNRPDANGISTKLPFLDAQGKGVHSGISRQAGSLSAEGQGVTRQLPTTPGRSSTGVARATVPGSIYDWMGALSERLRRVRICCGDWTRILGPAGTVHVGITGVFLDPPYSHEGRATELYTHDNADVWEAARAWAIEHGTDRRYRICLAGYSDTPEAMMPADWTWHTYKANGGYGNQGEGRYGNQGEGRGRANALRECLWYSPGCLSARQNSLFDTQEAG